MNKAIKDALAKGKVERAELDKKAAEEAVKRAEKKKADEAKEEAELQAAAESYLDSLPENLAKAVAKREKSFSLMTYGSDKYARFSALTKILEPKLKKMGLQFQHTSSVHWVQLSFDPDTGYDATYYHLEVIVPEDV